MRHIGLTTFPDPREPFVPEPPEIDPKHLARKLDAYRESAAAVTTLLTEHLKLVAGQTSAAAELQRIVGHDVIIFHRGYAYVPHIDGSRPCYVIMPVFDLDAARIGETIASDKLDSMIQAWTPPTSEDDSR